MSRALPLAALAAALTVLAGAATASAAEPAPFGHAGTAQSGVRFCPTTDPATRPLSFDVTLPPTGDGPFPTILLLHGLGGSKTSFEGASGFELTAA